MQSKREELRDVVFIVGGRERERIMSGLIRKDILGRSESLHITEFHGLESWLSSVS